MFLLTRPSTLAMIQTFIPTQTPSAEIKVIDFGSACMKANPSLNPTPKPYPMKAQPSLNRTSIIIIYCSLRPSANPPTPLPQALCLFNPKPCAANLKYCAFDPQYRPAHYADYNAE